MILEHSAPVEQIVVSPDKNQAAIRRLIARKFNHVPPDARLLSDGEIVVHKVQSRCLIVKASEATIPIAHILGNGKHLPTHHPHVNLMIEIHGNSCGYLDVITISLNECTPYACVQLRAGTRDTARLLWQCRLSYHLATRWYPRVDIDGGRLSPRDTHKLQKWLWSVFDASGISQ